MQKLLKSAVVGGGVGAPGSAHAIVGACITNTTVTIEHWAGPDYNGFCPTTLYSNPGAGTGTNTWTVSYQTNALAGTVWETWTCGNGFAVGNSCGDTNAATLTLQRQGGSACCDAVQSVTVDVWTCDGSHYTVHYGLSYGEVLSTFQLVWTGVGDHPLQTCTLWGAADANCSGNSRE